MPEGREEEYFEAKKPLQSGPPASTPAPVNTPGGAVRGGGEGATESTLQGKMDELIENVQSVESVLSDVSENTSMQDHDLSDINVQTSLMSNALMDIRNSLSGDFVALKTSFDDLGDAIVGNDLEKAENDREQRSLLERLVNNTKKEKAGPGKGADADFEAQDGFLGKANMIAKGLGIAVAAVALIPGFFIGFAQGLMKTLKTFTPRVAARIILFFRQIRNFFQGLGKTILKPFKAVSASAAKIFAPIRAGIEAIKGKFLGAKKAITGNKAFGKLPKFFGSILDDIGKLFKSGPGKVFGKIGKGFKSFFGIIGKIFSPIRTFFGTVGKLAPKFLSIGKVIGNIAGKLFLPFTIIMGAFDGIRGFIDKFTGEDGNILQKITQGIGGAISGIAQGLIGMPLDLIKKGVAFIAGLFGFDGAKEALESFSFKDLIDKIIMAPINLITSAIGFIVDLFTNPKETLAKVGEVFGKIGGAIKKVLKAIVAFVLPKPDPSKAWWSPSQLAVKAIPKSVYEFAGIDKGTGQKIPAEEGMFQAGDGTLTSDPMEFDTSMLTDEAREAAENAKANLNNMVEEMSMLQDKLGEVNMDTRAGRREAAKIEKQMNALDKRALEEERAIRMAVERSEAERDTDGFEGGLITQEQLDAKEREQFGGKTYRELTPREKEKYDELHIMRQLNAAGISSVQQQNGQITGVRMQEGQAQLSNEQAAMVLQQANQSAPSNNTNVTNSNVTYVESEHGEPLAALAL